MSLRLLAAVVALSACRGDDPSTTPTDDTTDTDTDTDTGTPVIDTAWWPPFTGDTGDDDPILHDALSMPAEPTHEVADFESAQACQLCHSDHYDEWSTSMHAYAMVDPVFKALVAVRQADFDGTEDKFCLSCHSAIAVRSGEVQPGFDFAGVQGVVEEGITCESCHTISEVERVNNGGHVLDPAGPMRGPIEDPAQSSHHDSEYSELFTERSGELCGSCHDVIETNGLNLERPYEEFVESPAYEEGTRCQVCHMPETTEPAAAGGPDRQRSSHRFVGVDVPLLPGWASANDEQIIRDEVHELLQGSVQVELSTPSQVIAGEQLDVVIDAAGVSSTLKLAIDLVRPAGWVTKVGWGPKPLGFSIDPLVQKNVTLQGSFSHNWPIWERVISLLASKQLDVEPIVGGTFAIDQWQQAFEQMHHGQIVKSVILPGQS